MGSMRRNSRAGAEPPTSAVVAQTYRTRRASLIASTRNRVLKLQPPIMWDIQGMRGQMSSNCLWHACKAFVLGVLIFAGGAAMCVAGFYIDGVLGDPYGISSGESNSTWDPAIPTTTTPIPYQPEQTGFYQVDPTRPGVKFSKLSYIGPIIMGIGGFIIVATCVMTCEARDSAAKVGPSFGASASSASTAAKNATAVPLAIPLLLNQRMKGRTRSSIDVRSVASQTVDGGSSLSLAATTMQLFDRKLIVDAFRKFSKTLRTSASITSSNAGDEHLQRYPSAPSLLGMGPVGAGSATTAAAKSASQTVTAPFLARSRCRPPPAALRAMSTDHYPSRHGNQGPESTSTGSSSSRRESNTCSGRAAILTTSTKNSKVHRQKQKRFKRHVSVPIEQSRDRRDKVYYDVEGPPGPVAEGRRHSKSKGASSSTSTKSKQQQEGHEQEQGQDLLASSKIAEPAGLSPSTDSSSGLRNVSASVHSQPQQPQASSTRSSTTNWKTEDQRQLLLSPKITPTKANNASETSLIKSPSTHARSRMDDHDEQLSSTSSTLLVSHVPHYNLRTQSEDLPGAGSSSARISRYRSEQEQRPMLTRQQRIVSAPDHHHEIICMPTPTPTMPSAADSLILSIPTSRQAGTTSPIQKPSCSYTTTIIEENESEG